MHTRAASVLLSGSVATLVAPGGMRMRMRIQSTPAGACGDWRTAVVQALGPEKSNFLSVRWATEMFSGPS